jgi:hypothetical protein
VRQIPYNNSAATLRFEYPPNWVAQTITGINIQITDLDGTDLLAATAATLWTATTLSAAASVGDSTITLTAATLSPGDRLEIAASASGPKEQIEVRSYNSSTKVVTLARDLRFAHANTTAVKGLFATYDLDTSTVATWPKSKQVVLIWIPAGSDDLPHHERGEVANFDFGVPDFEERFRALYPTEAMVLAHRGHDGFGKHYQETLRHLRVHLWSRGLHLERVKNTEIVAPSMFALARLLVVRGGGDKLAHEQDAAEKEFRAQFEVLTSEPIWVDQDQDDARDDAEIDDYSGTQLMGSERAI